LLATTETTNGSSTAAIGASTGIASTSLAAATPTVAPPPALADANGTSASSLGSVSGGSAGDYFGGATGSTPSAGGGSAAQPAPTESEALADLASDFASFSTGPAPAQKQPVSELIPGLLKLSVPIDPATAQDQDGAGQNAHYSMMGNKASW